MRNKTCYGGIWVAIPCLIMLLVSCTDEQKPVPMPPEANLDNAFEVYDAGEKTTIAELSIYCDYRERSDTACDGTPQSYRVYGPTKTPKVVSSDYMLQGKRANLTEKLKQKGIVAFHMADLQKYFYRDGYKPPQVQEKSKKKPVPVVTESAPARNDAEGSEPPWEWLPFIAWLLGLLVLAGLFFRWLLRPYDRPTEQTSQTDQIVSHDGSTPTATTANAATPPVTTQPGMLVLHTTPGMDVNIRVGQPNRFG